MRPALAAAFLAALLAAGRASAAWDPADGGPRFLFERPLIRLNKARLTAGLPPGCSSLAGPACLYADGDDEAVDEPAAADGEATAARPTQNAAGGFQVLVLPPNDAAVAAMLRGDVQGAAAALDLASARVVYQGNTADGDADSVAAAVAGAVGAAGAGAAPEAGAALRSHLATVLAGAAAPDAAAAAAQNHQLRAALDVVEGRLGDAAAPAARAAAPRRAPSDPLPAAEAGLAALDDADPAAPPPEGSRWAGGWGGGAPPDDTPFPPANASALEWGDGGDDYVGDEYDEYYDDDYYDADELDEIDPFR